MTAIAALVLAGIAVILAWPAPLLLARARWPVRRPAAALVLWQGIGLGGGCALLAAELTLAAVPGIEAAGLVAFGLTGLWLVVVLLTSALRVAAARRRHRYLLDLLAERDPSVGELDILAHPAAMAYSVPGWRSRIVVSQGATEVFNPAELAAVVEHERAHLRQHHDLVVQPFLAWRRSFPFLRSAAVALAAVERLTEYLADDAAQHRAGREPLRAALRLFPDVGRDLAVRRARLRAAEPASR